MKAWQRRSPTDYFGANCELRDATDALLKVRLPLDASDAEVCDAAEHQARRCMDRLAMTSTLQQARTSMERICSGQGITPPPPDKKDGPAVARMCCPLWWRRKLRKHQGQTVEAAAVRLGYVSRYRDLYVSEERLKARLQQNRRNAATLEATTATNEDGQAFTLAELAAKSTANKSIRRAELMTRIAGFERYAGKEGDAGLFITLTCPSRFHRHMMVNNGTAAVPNPKYDPRETPRTGHEYLTRVWARARAAIHRRDLHPYGFRISEPQHDGTPHWHLLIFSPAEQVDALLAILRKYALQDSGDEPGAAQHRLDFKVIDKAKGTAAGYIAKYVAKNIDGEHVGEDLEGRPAKESAKRVEAWAATWRVRQFQQVGGASVMVWRELRKVRAIPADAPEHLKQAHRAASKRAARQEGDETATVAWDDYCRAQGGMNCGRKGAIQLARCEASGYGRYGDAAGPRPFGVLTTGVPTGSDGQTETEQASRAWLIESERRNWTVHRKPDCRDGWGVVAAATAKPAQPWTRVNNCTPVDAYEAAVANCQLDTVIRVPTLPHVQQNFSAYAGYIEC